MRWRGGNNRELLAAPDRPIPLRARSPRRGFVARATFRQSTAVINFPVGAAAQIC